MTSTVAESSASSSVPSGQALTGPRRDHLLADVERIAKNLQYDPAACQQAATALAVLHRHGPDRLRATLDHTRSGAAEPAWQALRRVLRVYIDHMNRTGKWEGPGELAFVLGWLHRRGRILAADAGTNRQRRSP